ncbi:MAG: BamA/TamA family outer membrane protein [Paracoccaceae bacterium]
MPETTLDAIPTGEATEFGFSSGSLIAVPIPFSNPTIGNGLAGGGAWLFSADSASRTSTIGLGGFRSDNGSSAVAFGADLKLNANRYMVSLLAGKADLKYDFTAGPFDIPLEQSGDLYKLEFSYGFSREFSVGVGFRYAETALSTSFAGSLPLEISATTDLKVFKFGLVSNWDRRDSDIYPTRGSLITLDMFRGEVSGFNGKDYEKAIVKGSYFRPIFEDGNVLALSATLCHASDTAPFFDACSIGLTDGLRGFSVTEYIGDRLVSAQAEYRGRIGKRRLGYVAFAGAGSVQGTLTSETGLHAAAGVGVRYRLSEAFPVDFSVDVSANTDGETLYYIYVGQSF